MEYKIIYGALIATVEDAVNELAAEGWQPHGALVFAGADAGERWVQAMVRYSGSMLSQTYEVARESADWTMP